MKPFVVFDTETTGVTPDDRPCQIAAALVDACSFEVVSSFATLLNPGRPIHPKAQEVHGISDSDVSDAPTLDEFVKGSPLSTWLAETDILCGHNVRFDMRMCQEVLPHPNYLVLDTLTLARCRHPKLPNHRLQTLVTELGLPPRQAHDALGDVLSCIDYLQLVADGQDVYELQQYSQTCMKEANKVLLQKVGAQ